MGIERDLLKNSKYIIAFYNQKDTKITHLMLQKLLYFLEAVYMVIEDEDYLSKEDFYAWNFGPVNDVIYQEYKYYGKLPIVLDENIEINPINKRYIEKLYDLFHDFNAFTLVSLSHSEGSPWNEIYRKYGLEIPENEIVDKGKTKKWFNSLVDITNGE